MGYARAPLDGADSVPLVSPFHILVGGLFLRRYSYQLNEWKSLLTMRFGIFGDVVINTYIRALRGFSRQLLRICLVISSSRELDIAEAIARERPTLRLSVRAISTGEADKARDSEVYIRLCRYLSTTTHTCPAASFL